MDIQKYKILIIIIILLEPKGKRNFKIFEVEFVSEYNVFHLSTQHDSFFENPTGFDGETQFTTAEDLVKLSKFALANANFSKIVATSEKTVTSVDGLISHKLVNINELVGKVPGVLGIKTGWTENAKENLVTYVKRDDRVILIAMLASNDRFGETEDLIEFIFDNYSWEPSLES